MKLTKYEKTTTATKFTHEVQLSHPVITVTQCGGRSWFGLDTESVEQTNINKHIEE